MFLATTALTEFWDRGEEILLLGPWCRRPDRRSDWEGLRARMLPSPWDDRERFHDAAEYLDRRMEEILLPLSEALNGLLRQRGSVRYWRILLGTWLLHSLHVAYDRYVHLTSAFEGRPNLRTFLLDPSLFRTPATTLTAVRWMMDDDLYNLQIFSQLMTGMGCSFPTRVPAPEGASRNGSSSALSVRRLFHAAARGIQSALLRTAGGCAEAALIEMYCPASALWRLCWKSRFRAVPWSVPEDPPHGAGEPTGSLLASPPRRTLAALPATDEFTRLWVRSLPENLPSFYLEGFQTARERALRQVRRFPGTLFSATGWHYSEGFKFLAAELSQRGGRLVAVQHGGGYGLFRSMPMEQHERRVSDSFLGWEEVPALQMDPFRRRRSLRRGNGRCLLVATTNPRYPFRFYSAPQAHQLEQYFEWQVRFLESLGESVRSRLTIRLHPLDFGHCLRQRLEERFADLRWDAKRRFPVSAAMSRLLVVDHPGTPLLYTLAANRPTLLFWDTRVWEFNDEACSHLESLREAGLFYEDPGRAAGALQQLLREGPERWWSQPSIQAARRRFVQRYVPSPADGISSWWEQVKR